ncbi:MAG: ABC transporter substrate-binding protein, partial [Actinobacteria bacterium]|nr:ABC transporter substrate-binding protein [Actinomycetota bacterium]
MILAGATAFALALTSCSGGGKSSDNGDTGTSGAVKWELTEQTAAPTGDAGTITWASYAEPLTLDYAYAYDYMDRPILANVCESLLRMNPDLSLSPGLAESFSNPTPTTWVYELRKGVKFHDGSELTADDAVASMKRHMDPNVGSSWGSVYRNVTSIKKTGPLEVTVTTTIPDAQFNETMGSTAGVIESAATLKKLGKDYGNSTGGVNCTGPFQFASWKSGEKVSLTRFDGYWDSERKAKSAGIDFVIMNDSTARVNALKSGEADGTWLLPENAVEQLRASGAGDVLFGTNTAVMNLVVSNLDGPLGDVRVRKALLMAMDRHGILQAAKQGIGEVTDVHSAESVWNNVDPAAKKAAFEDITHYDYNLDEAKKLIAEAGATGKEITFVTAPIGQEFAVTSQATAAAANSIGLKAKIETVTPDQYGTLFVDESARKGVDLFYTQWDLSSSDALEALSIFRTGEFPNYGKWSNAEFDKIVEQAGGTMDPQARSVLTAKAQQIANAELPWLPLYT